MLVSPLGTDTTRPLGRASVNATPVSVVPPFGLVRVKVSVLVPLTGTEAGPKALAIDGGAMTVRTAVAVFPVPPLAELTAPVVLVKVPAVVPVTLAATVQVVLAATEPPVSEMAAPPAPALAVPPQVLVSPLGTDTTRPLGRASVNATPVSVVPPFGLVRVKVSVLVPFSGTEAGPKALAIDGGAGTMTSSWHWR